MPEKVNFNSTNLWVWFICWMCHTSHNPNAPYNQPHYVGMFGRESLAIQTTQYRVWAASQPINNNKYRAQVDLTNTSTMEQRCGAENTAPALPIIVFVANIGPQQRVRAQEQWVVVLEAPSTPRCRFEADLRSEMLWCALLVPGTGKSGFKLFNMNFMGIQGQIFFKLLGILFFVYSETSNN